MFRVDCRQPFPYRIMEGLPVIRAGTIKADTDPSAHPSQTFGRPPLLPFVVGTSTRRRLDSRSTKLGWNLAFVPRLQIYIAPVRRWRRMEKYAIQQARPSTTQAPNSAE